MLGTFVDNKYITVIYDKIFKLTDRVKEYKMGLESLIEEEGLRERLRVHRRIDEGVSNIIWRGEKYERVSHYLSVVIANTNAINFSICLGFHVWYSLLPSLMIALVSNDINEILSPEVLKSFKDSTRGWSAPMIKIAAEICEDIKKIIMLETGGTLQTGGACTSGVGTSPETGTFDPLRLLGDETQGPQSVGEKTDKVVLRNLVIACLALCLLNTVSYNTVCVTELCNEFYEGHH
jgi:hypothetical protein